VVATANLSDEQRARLASSTFEEIEYSGVFAFESEMKGRVYGLVGEVPLQTLEEEVRVPIAIPDEPIDITRKIVSTPATIVYDAVVLPPVTFLMVLAMPMDGPHLRSSIGLRCVWCLPPRRCPQFRGACRRRNLFHK